MCVCVRVSVCLCFILCGDGEHILDIVGWWKSMMNFKCLERIRIFTLFDNLGLQLFWLTMVVLEPIKIVNQGMTV